jgi:hypothetical protein
MIYETFLQSPFYWYLISRRYSCDEIDLTSILAGFPVMLTQFPIKYLGLPLSLKRLRRVDLQAYINKAASRLNLWKAKFLNHAGCAAGEAGFDYSANFSDNCSQG